MKKIRLLAIVLCAVVLVGSVLSGCQSKPIVVGQVGKVNVTSKDVDLFASFILMNNYMTRADITDPEIMNQLMTQSLEQAATYEALMQKGKQLGAAPLSADEQKEITDQVNGYIDSLKESFQAEADEKASKDKSVDPDKEVQKMVDAKLKEDGLTSGDLIKLLTFFKVEEKLRIEADKNISMTDEEVQKAYDDLVASQKESFDADSAAYEDAQGAGETIVYVPAGFRYVKHILVALSEDDQNAIYSAQSSGDAEEAKKLRDEALPKIKAKADEALAKARGGQDFDALITEYGEDPGMTQEPAKTSGYQLGSSTAFVEEFKEAALKLAKVGDITDLVASDFGYHIIKWVGDVTPGPVALDQVKDVLKESALADKQNESWAKTVEQWKTEIGVTTYPDKLAMLPPQAATPTPAEAVPQDEATPAAS